MGVSPHQIPVSQPLLSSNNMKAVLLIALAACTVVVAEDELLKTEDKYFLVPYPLVPQYLRLGAGPFSGGFRSAPATPNYQITPPTKKQNKKRQTKNKNKTI